MATQTEQVREAVTISGVVKFKVSIVVTDKGDIPSKALFVITINNTLDSKEDTFARVATIPDFEELVEDRGTAVDDDDLEYRVSTFVLWYDDLETAVNAQKVLKERIDELVDDYETYQSQFVTVSEVTTHPQVGESTYQAAVTAYQDAMRDTLDAEEDRDDAEEDYNEKSTEADAATVDLAKAKEISEDCADTKGWFDLLYTAFVTLDADGDTVLAAAETYYAAKVTSPVPDSYDVAFRNALDAFIADLKLSEAQKTQSGSPGHQQEFATICGSRAGEYASAQTAKTTADTDLGTARSAFEDAQTAVETAQQAENAALAAVQALKSDFDPTSVEPTPADES
jgi:hypothetical protein